MAWTGRALKGGVSVAAVAIALGACNNQFGGDMFNDGSGDGATESESNSAGNGSSPTDDGMVDGSSGGSESAEEGGGPKLDVMPPDGGLNPCGCEFSYIWISNANESTVSKINVLTLEEEARYLTRQDSAGNPSRTSVNLSGDVAIANRHGGLVKFWAEEDDCVESNGMPGIQTSHGPNELLAWDVEECRAWYADFPGVTNQRPVAWTPGTVAAGTCDSIDAQVWTVVSATPGIAPGTGGPGGVIAYLLDGEDGSVVEEIAIDEFSGGQLGAYGGAVDANGNLYFTPMGGITFGGKLARVELETLDVTLWDLEPGVAPYGITVDHNNMVWISGVLGAGAARFDPDTAVWDQVEGFVSLGGLMEGPDDLMWVATSTGALSLDINTLDVGPVFTTNMGGETKGISVDASGHIWVVNEIAFKVDPQTATAVDFYNGLTSPYTYSDMTGYALGNVTCPPEG